MNFVVEVTENKTGRIVIDDEVRGWLMVYKLADGLMKEYPRPEYDVRVYNRNSLEKLRVKIARRLNAIVSKESSNG